MLTKKIGRPIVGQPKSVKLTIRVEEQSFKILDDYCKKNEMSHADGVRTAIKALKNK